MNMLNISRLTSVSCLVFACSWAIAQTGGQIAGASANEVPLYAQPGAAHASRNADAKGFPWPILEEKNDFYRVRVDGEDYWVDSMSVRVERKSSARCTPRVAQNDRTGATPGAGENACK